MHTTVLPHQCLIARRNIADLFVLFGAPIRMQDELRDAGR
jgi:hypothetical protein